MQIDAVLCEKKQLRKQILEYRAALPEDTVFSHSNIIIEKLTSLDDYVKSQTLMCFIDFRKEVRSRLIIDHALENGKRVLVPIIVKEPDGMKTMMASHLIDFENDLESGTMGILEPKPEKRRFVDPQEIDFFVTPGVAFDIHKNRLGYGGGYHDMIFRKLREDCKKVAICFDFQVFDRIPVLDYDVPVNMVLTEKRTII